jgi:glycosyltransferase involved in cell wall biosynthesis
MSKLISVIIPAFEKEKHIKRCLDSVLNQTYTNLEILIVYLSGKDGTLDIIKSFTDSRIKLINQEKKTGPGGSRNIGLKEAKGEYIGFVDTDDYISVDFYDKLYNAAEKYNADISFGEIIVVETCSKWFFSFHNREDVLSDFLYKYSSVKNGAVFDKLFRADLIRRNNLFFPEGVLWEDNPWLLKVVFFSEKVVLVDGAIYYYLLHDFSFEHKKKLKNDIMVVVSMMMDFANKQKMTYLQRNIVKDKAISFAEFGFDNKIIRKSIRKLLGEYRPLNKKLRKIKIREFRHWIFNISLKEKKFTIFGFKFNKR